MRQPSVRARRVAAVSVSLVLAAGAAACGPKDNDAKGADSGDSKPQKGGTLTVLNSNPQDAVHTGPEGQGHRGEVRGAPDLLGPVQGRQQRGRR